MIKSDGVATMLTDGVSSNVRLTDAYFTDFNKSTTNGLTAVNIHNDLLYNVILDDVIIKAREVFRYRGPYGYGIPYGWTAKVRNARNEIVAVLTFDEPYTDVFLQTIVKP
jgi:hypothetical protein